MVTTDASGQTAIITLFYTQTAPSPSTTTDFSTSSASAAAAASSSASSNGASISISAIIGICVAGGAVVFALIGCAIWRMKRKTGDEDEAIRW